MLGLGRYDVQVWNRGGTRQIARLNDVTQIEWARELDETSTGKVTCVSDEWADLIHPWMHEIHLFRNRELVWCGPVRDKTYAPSTGEVTLDLRDLFAWMDRRVLHDEIDVEQADMADIFKMVLDSALSPDPSPRISTNLQAAGTKLDFYADPEFQKYAGDYLRELAESGVDFTVLNRTVYIRGEEMDAKPIGILHESHFAEMPVIKESGEVATLLLLTGPGGEFHSHPDFQNTPQKWADHPYGLLEVIADATTLFDTDDENAVEKAAKARYELMKQPQLYVTEATLDKSAPVGINELLPGKRVDIRMQARAIPLMTQYRLQKMSVSVSGEDMVEDVKIEMASLGTFDPSKVGT